MQGPRKALIIGGSGMLGQALATSMVNAGFEVRITSRRKLPSSSTSEVEWSGKKLTPEFLEAVAWSDAVINLTGEGLFAKRWSNDYKRELLESRVNTTKLIVEAIMQAAKKPEVFVNASAVGYYGETKSIVDESTPGGNDFLATLCEQWEQAAGLAANYTRVVNLRSGIVLSDKGGFLKQLLPIFKLWLGGRFGSGKQWLSWIHVDDWLGAVKAIVGNANFSGPINLTSPFPVTYKHFAIVLGKAAARPMLMRYPKFLLQLLLGEAATGLLTSQQVMPSKLLKAGFKFKFPQLAAALNDLIL